MYGWHRIASFLAHVARVKPKLIFGKFVDDFFGLLRLGLLVSPVAVLTILFGACGFP